MKYARGVVGHLVLLLAACSRHHAMGTEGPVTAADDGAMRVWSAADGVHLANLTNDRLAYAVYERHTLLERSSDRDACMLSRVAQCPSVAARETAIVPMRGVITAHGTVSEVAVRYWRAKDSDAYPASARIVTARIR